MARIVIRNIGPLRDTGVVELVRFNVLIGKQSSGKSTFMKIVCFCQWVEKKIMTSSEREILAAYTHNSRFLRELKQFHRFNDAFFGVDSEIHYTGECVSIDLTGNQNVKITRVDDFEDRRHNSKLSFIPSERNLVSAIKDVDIAYRRNDYDALFNHVFEWGEAKEHAVKSEPVNLRVVDDMEYYYDKEAGVDVIRQRRDGSIFTPFYASSGVQSALPIVVMTEYYTETIFSNMVDLSRREVSELVRRIMDSGTTTDTDVRDILDKVSQIYNYHNAKLYIEEPEQNLFPESQQKLVEYVVSQINKASVRTGKPSSVMVTTHSPYVITAFNVLLKASVAAEKNPEATYSIVPKEAIIHPEDVCAYFIKEDGTFVSIMDKEIVMIGGVELDNASDIVEENMNRLNDVIYG